jgi:hypothetical protein
MQGVDVRTPVIPAMRFNPKEKKKLCGYASFVRTLEV